MYRRFGNIDFSVYIFRKLQACLLTYSWSEMPEPWSLDEVTSIRLETFYRCNAFQDLHN